MCVKSGRTNHQIARLTRLVAELCFTKKKLSSFFYTIPLLLNGLLWDFLPQIYTLLFHSWGEESNWICIKKAKWDSNSRKLLRRVISGAELVAKHWIVFYFLRNVLLLLLLNPGKPLATISPRKAPSLLCPWAVWVLPPPGCTVWDHHCALQCTSRAPPNTFEVPASWHALRGKLKS